MHRGQLQRVDSEITFIRSSGKGTEHTSDEFQELKRNTTTGSTAKCNAPMSRSIETEDITSGIRNKMPEAEIGIENVTTKKNSSRIQNVALNYRYNHATPVAEINLQKLGFFCPLFLFCFFDPTQLLSPEPRWGRVDPWSSDTLEMDSQEYSIKKLKLLLLTMLTAEYIWLTWLHCC